MKEMNVFYGVKCYFVHFVVVALLLSCCGGGNDDIGSEFVEKRPIYNQFTNIEVVYIGDDIGEAQSDGWLIKFYTDMEMDELGNFVGPGAIMQLLLNVPYAENQEPNLSLLVGEYVSQNNSGDFSPNTFVYGYMDYIDLPDGRHERPDATFFAEIADASTEMSVDFIDDGRLNIMVLDNGKYSISGALVGKQCRKRNFSWQGAIDPKSEVIPEIKNSLLTTDLHLDNLTHALLQDRGDYFYLKDQSYRDFLLFLADDTIDLSTGRPQGSGNLLRLELLVPWSAKVEDGIPVGTYTVIQRNEDTSLNRDDIAPFHVVSGLPNRFSYPYWSGAWYVWFDNDAWGDSYARIDSGTITIERGEGGSHRIVCSLRDCSNPSFAITTDTTITDDKFAK